MPEPTGRGGGHPEGPESDAGRGRCGRLPGKPTGRGGGHPEGPESDAGRGRCGRLPGKCQTRYFAVMDYRDDSVIRLPRGIPGFESEREFVLIDQPSHRPLVFFQSLRTPHLCFLALPVLSVDRSYQLAVLPEDLALLGLDASRQPKIGEEVMCLCLIAIDENRTLSANLLSPIVINLGLRVAVQAIQTGCHYSHRHPLSVEEPEPVCS